MPTKADLETALNAEKKRADALDAALAKQKAEFDKKAKEWGTGALNLAQENGWCETVQEYLDEKEIPYSNGERKFKLTLTYYVKARSYCEEASNRTFIENSVQEYAVCIDPGDLFDSDWSDVEVSLSNTVVSDIEEL